MAAAALAVAAVSQIPSAGASERTAVHTSLQCAKAAPGTPTGSVPVACPPASVYTKWAHVTYTQRDAVKIASSGATRAATPDASFNCTVYASDPFWEDTGYVIGGEGAQFCSGAGWSPERVRVALETYVGVGVWDIRVRDGSGWSTKDSSDYTVYWDCAGSGTHTDRVVVDGYADGGVYSQSVQSQNDPRLTCKSG